MSRHHPAFRWSLIALLGLLAGPVAAQPDSFLYTLNAKGVVSVNSTELDGLSSNYKPGDEDGEVNGQQRWLDMVVEGHDRYMLRVDGRLAINGANGPKLPFSLIPNDVGVIPFWYRLEAFEGALFAVRTDGLIYQDGDTSVQLPKQEGQFVFGFSNLCAVPTDGGHDLYVLRVDGSIWRVGDDGPGFLLRGDLPPEGETEPETELDGQFPSTAWMVMEHDPVTGLLHAVRRDGVVMAFDPADYAPVVEPDPGEEGDPKPPNGTVLARLIPFQAPGNTNPPIETYPTLAFDAEGRWVLLRYDGRVFRATTAGTPEDPIDELEEELNFVGSGQGEPYVAMVVSGDELWVLRSSGRVFESADVGTEVFDVKGALYGFMAVSPDAPDGSNFKNNKPQLIQYKPKLSEGDGAQIPVIPWDLDLATADILVSVDLSDLAEDAPGASWDEVAGVVDFPAGPPKGSYKILVTLDDGQLKKPKTFKLNVKVMPADDKPEKNKPPLVTKVNKVTAFVGQELVLPILVSDRDDDELVLSVLDKKNTDIFELGAVFDDETNTITWTPSQEHAGKQVGYLLVQEVGPEKPKSKKLKIKIDVVSQLIFATPEDEG